MSNYVSEDLRRLVATRASHLCEYCLIYEYDTFFGCQVDHIISLKHKGKTESENLAYSCVFCNRYKGSDIGSILSSPCEFVRFYNPQSDHWHEHFMLDGIVINPLTKIGETTAQILKFNDSDRLLERHALSEIGRYPTESALDQISP